MTVATPSRQVRLAPVILAVLFGFAMLKAAGLWINFSSAAADEPVAVAAAAPLTPPESPTSQRLLDQLAARQSELDAREAQLDTREKLLAAAELKLEREIGVLQSEQESLQTLRADRQNSQDQDYEALSNAYERMKARDAARIFNVLDDEILVPVAAGMRTQSLAGVLAEMEPTKATGLTKALAGKLREARATAPLDGQ